MLSLTPIFALILFLSTTRASDNNWNSNEPFHWTALITPIFDNNGEWNCSGAYIGKKHVITSGVCVEAFSKFRIRLGAYYTYNPESNTTRLEFKYDRVVSSNIGSKHDSPDNRLTIIRLDEDTSLSSGEYIQPIALPPEPTLVQLNDALGLNTSELLWVQNKNGDLAQQAVNINVLLFLDCVTLRPEINVHKEICAAGDKVDGKYHHVCPKIGDGPLLVAGTHYVMLIGIGRGNCVENKPQTFIRINGYWKWIMEVQSYVD